VRSKTLIHVSRIFLSVLVAVAALARVGPPNERKLMARRRGAAHIVIILLIIIIILLVLIFLTIQFRFRPASGEVMVSLS